MKTKGHETCARKRRYWSEIDAKIVATKREPHAGIPLYAYQCPACDGWHITKQPRAEVAA